MNNNIKDTTSLVFVKGRNLINPNLLRNGAVARGTGVYGFYGYAVVTDFIPIEPGTYTVKLFNPGDYRIYRIAGYDENKSYLWDDSEFTVTERSFTATTTKYIRICFEYNNYQGLSPQGLMTAQPQLEQGSATTYQAYVDKKILTKNSGNVFEEFYEEKETEPFLLNCNYSVDTQNSYAVGDIVNINLNMYNSTALTKDTWIEFATIPAKYRPPTDVYLSAYGADGGWTSPVAVPIKIDSTGKIYAFLKTTVKRIVISGSYLQS